MSIESDRPCGLYTIEVFVDDPRTGKRLLVSDTAAPTNKQCRRQWERIDDVREFGGFSVFWAMFTEDCKCLAAKMVEFEMLEQMLRMPVADLLEVARDMDYEYAQFYRDLAEIEESDTREDEIREACY